MLTARRAIVNQHYNNEKGMQLDSFQPSFNTTNKAGGFPPEIKEEDIIKSNIIFAKQKMKNQDSILRPRVLKLKSQRLRYPKIDQKRNLSDTQEWW